jgi:inner membrane protein
VAVRKSIPTVRFRPPERGGGSERAVTGVLIVTGATVPVSIHGAGLDHRLYVLVAVVTHALVGYTLVSVFRTAPPLAGLVGGVLPDVDLLFAPDWSFPLVHRGLTHTPVCGAVVVGAVWLGASWRSDRQSSRRSGLRGTATALALGYGSHLVLDSLTVSGVPWLYPVAAVQYGVDAGIHGPGATLLLWLCCAFVLLRDRLPAGESSQ